MQAIDEPCPGDDLASRGVNRRRLLGLVTAALAAGVIPEAWLAEAAYGATPRWNRPFDKWVPITSTFGPRASAR